MLTGRARRSEIPHHCCLLCPCYVFIYPSPLRLCRHVRIPFNDIHIPRSPSPRVRTFSQRTSGLCNNPTVRVSVLPGTRNGAASAGPAQIEAGASAVCALSPRPPGRWGMRRGLGGRRCGGLASRSRAAARACAAAPRSRRPIDVDEILQAGARRGGIFWVAELCARRGFLGLLSHDGVVMVRV